MGREASLEGAGESCGWGIRCRRCQSGIFNSHPHRRRHRFRSALNVGGGGIGDDHGLLQEIPPAFAARSAGRGGTREAGKHGGGGRPVRQSAESEGAGKGLGPISGSGLAGRRWWRRRSSGSPRQGSKQRMGRGCDAAALCRLLEHAGGGGSFALSSPRAPPSAGDGGPSDGGESVLRAGWRTEGGVAGRKRGRRACQSGSGLAGGDGRRPAQGWAGGATLRGPCTKRLCDVRLSQWRPVLTLRKSALAAPWCGSVREKSGHSGRPAPALPTQRGIFRPSPATVKKFLPHLSPPPAESSSSS